MKTKFRNFLLPYFIKKRKSYAQEKLDLKLAPYLDFNHGFFVEAGANDGVSQSNTYYFEKYMGWQGLLVEAIPVLAEKCRQRRPKCIVENCGLVAFDYPSKTIDMLYCNLMSMVKGELGDEYEQEHNQKGIQYLKAGEQTYIITVPAKPLSDILDKNNVNHIHLLSLDVEGYEPQVLMGLDLKRHRPDFMLIEVRCRDEVEAVIGDDYDPIAILNISKSFSDILYRAK